jgi:hypothetical protein
VAAGRAETVYSSGAVGMAIRRGYPGHAHGCFKSFKGGVTGAVTAGIGEKFGAVGGGFKTFGQKLGHELGRAMTHATAQTAIGLAFGDQNPGATYAAGFAGSMVGSGLGAAFEGKKFANAAQILGSGAVSGATAELTGGNFWGGFAQGAITSWANHTMHKLMVENPEDFHVVQSGESLQNIANRHGITVEQLLKWNKLTGISSLDGVGQSPTSVIIDESYKGAILIVSQRGYDMVYNRWFSSRMKYIRPATIGGSAVGGTIGLILEFGGLWPVTQGKAFTLGVIGGGAVGWAAAEAYLNSTYYWHVTIGRVYYNK